MKKRIIIISTSLLLLSGVIFFLMSSHPAPVEPSSPADAKTLKDLGFTNSYNLKMDGMLYDRTLNPEVFKKWSDLGYTYFSSDAITRICADNNYIMGPAINFKSVIPAENIKEMQSKIDKLVTQKTFVYKIVYEPDIEDIGTGATHWEGYISENDIEPSAMRPDGTLNNDRAYLVVKNINSLMKCPYQHRLDVLTISKVSGQHISNLVFVIAPQEDFNTDGMSVSNFRLFKPKPVDPIVVCVVDDGYVELTHWIR